MKSKTLTAALTDRYAVVSRRGSATRGARGGGDTDPFRVITQSVRKLDAHDAQLLALYLVKGCCRRGMKIRARARPSWPRLERNLRRAAPPETRYSTISSS